MRIANRDIGIDAPPLIIAEVGINHGGDLEIAKQMAFLAAASGAECIKHQTHFPDDEMTEAAKEIFPPNDSRSIWDVIVESSLTQDEERQFKKYAEGLGLLYISTPFSRQAADFLDAEDVPAFKIGSGECDNLPLIRHIAKFGRPVILSTGMQSIDGLSSSVNILREAGVDFALLECTNLYPSAPEFVSLKGIFELKEAFPDAVVGFSDHSIGPEMALASIALGACIVERHFTDSRYRLGPDIACSMDPAQLRYLIDRGHDIYTARNITKKRSIPEEAVYRFARASVVADRDLPAGTTIRETDIWVRRPGDGEIPAYEFDKILGLTLKESVIRNQQLRWSYFD